MTTADEDDRREQKRDILRILAFVAILGAVLIGGTVWFMYWAFADFPPN